MLVQASALPALAAALVLLPAAYCDLRQHRIPNALSVGGAVLALALHAGLGGSAGLAAGLAGFALAFALVVPFHALGWLGAGDVKLIAASGAFAGSWWWSLVTVASIVTTGLAMALAVIVWRRQAGEVAARLGGWLALSASLRRPLYIGPAPQLAQVHIPYGLAIALGTGIAFAARASVALSG